MKFLMVTFCVVIDPCDSKPCGPNAECSVTNHAPQCHCPKYGLYTGDPYELSRGCIQGIVEYIYIYFFK